MVLSDLAKSGLESDAWVDGYGYQNKDKKHYRHEKQEYVYVIFYVQCIKAKPCDSPPCNCCHLSVRNKPENTTCPTGKAT